MMRADRKALAAILAATAVSVALAEEPDWKRQLRETLRRKVSFEFVDTPLNEALSFLQTLARVNIVVDPRIPQLSGTDPISLKVKEITLDRALRKLLKAANLDYALAREAIFISTPQGVARELRRRAKTRAPRKEEIAKHGLARVLQRKVSFEFVATPLSEAIAFLEREAGVKMVLSSRALRECGRTPINLRVKDMSLELALDWILKLADLEHSLGDDAVYIFTPDEKRAGEEPFRR